MPQHAFHMTLHEGAAQDYRRLHAPVPAAVLDQLERAGVRDYSIFVDGVHVFGVFEYDDPDRLHAELREDVAPDWTAAVTALFAVRRVDPELSTIAGLERVFRFPAES